VGEDGATPCGSGRTGAGAAARRAGARFAARFLPPVFARRVLRAVFVDFRAAFFVALRPPRPAFRFPAFFLPRALRFFAITLPLVSAISLPKTL
jgi:hypothetical protein